MQTKSGYSCEVLAPFGIIAEIVTNVGTISDTSAVYATADSPAKQNDIDAVPVADNVARVQERMAEAALRSNREPADVTLIAVTKTVSASRVLAAVNAGVTHFGENYVQEARVKIPEVNTISSLSLTWHFIGQLQTNKAKYVSELFDYVQTIDRFSLAEEISRQALKRNQKQSILVEINLSGETHRGGVTPEKLPELLAQILELPNLTLCGLMGIPPTSNDAEKAGGYFARLRSLWENLPRENQQILSMGMSGDFEQAIEEGATHVRVGTALFGNRR